MKPFTKIAAAFLGVIAVGHIVRVLAGWEVVAHGMVIPVWWSAPAAIFTGGLAVMILRELRS